MMLLIFSALLLLAAAGLVMYALLKRQRDASIVALRIALPDSTGMAGRRRSLFLGLDQLDGKLDGEVPRLLDQLGWRSTERRARYYALQLGVPLLAGLAAAGITAYLSNGGPSLLAIFASAGVGFLLPKRWLRGAVAKRRVKIAEEVSTMLPLLRMLFEVGMTVEQSIRALSQEGAHILPELSIEFKRVLSRVDAGLDLASELTGMAERLDIDQLNDCVVILEQLIRQGGGAVASLISLKELFDDRRMTDLQEKVSKLSAKMSGTMVAFLFPALLIILAGPGFIAIFGALSGMNQ
ncbi:type II secretion system F family protein [Halomonas sp. MC140]|nr:type II secretion system F family protein [Halomonas sp. MC140]MDN7130817.1 type II secretion system F family protein [Halomonas sp. MC140]